MVPLNYPFFTGWVLSKGEETPTVRVEIAGVDDKCQITAVFTATAVGDFLPIQLIYQGKTAASLPAFTFPDDWRVMYTPNR